MLFICVQWQYEQLQLRCTGDQAIKRPADEARSARHHLSAFKASLKSAGSCNCTERREASLSVPGCAVNDGFVSVPFPDANGSTGRSCSGNCCRGRCAFGSCDLFAGQAEWPYLLLSLLPVFAVTV